MVMVRGFCIKSMDNSNRPVEGPNMAMPVSDQSAVTTGYFLEHRVVAAGDLRGYSRGESRE